jgi:hypothetical protein
MTTGYLADQLILLFTGGRPTVEGIYKEEIEALVKEALAQIAVEDYYNTYKLENQSTTVNGSWQTVLPLQLFYNSDLGYFAADLPADFIVLPKNRGVVAVMAEGKRLDQIDWERYAALKGGTLLAFSNRFYYAVIAGKIVILPACQDKHKWTSILATLAIANDASATQAQAMLVFAKVMPIMQMRYRIKPDMVTNENPDFNT